MPRIRWSHLFLASALLGLLTLTGCGSKPVTVQGKLVVPQGVALLETDSVEIRFAPEDDKAKGATTTVSVKDMSFTSNQVLPGKYKITVSITPYPGMAGSDKRAERLDPLNKAFSHTQTKLNVEIGSEPTHNITVDLAKTAVTKN